MSSWYYTEDGETITGKGTRQDGSPIPWTEFDDNGRRQVVSGISGVRFQLRDGGSYEAEGYYYSLAASNPAPDRYHNRTGLSLAITGPLEQPTTRVQETTEWTSFTLDEIRIAKQQEKNNYTSFVLTANFETRLASNWVILSAEENRLWFDSITGELHERMADDFYARNGGDYWPRNVPIEAVNVNTNRFITGDLSESQWRTMRKDLNLHDLAATDARERVQNDIDAAVAADDRAALVGIDVSNPAYLWPPVYTPETAPTSVSRAPTEPDSSPWGRAVAASGWT